MSKISIQIANKDHLSFIPQICEEMAASAKVKSTGIAVRSPKYLESKIVEGKAVVAFNENRQWVGFCYIETWQSGAYVANSGLIIAQKFRRQSLAKQIKKKVFELSQTKYPNSKIFGLTTGLAVMKINSELGYNPVTYSELTKDEQFWSGCKGCVNYNILIDKQFKNCLCTAMLYLPNKKVKISKSEKIYNENNLVKPRIHKVLDRITKFSQSGFINTKYKKNEQ